MTSDIHFETPENIKVLYRGAGLGTRFIAWLIDFILLWVVAISIFIFLLLLGVSVDVVVRDVFSPGHRDGSARATLYLLAIFWLVFSLSSLLYFGVCELLMRGQTPGKRRMGIRVVKADGFSLDAVAIFLRTIFRIVDHSPPLWIVPIVTEKGQRLGDLVAGTLVVADQASELSGVREDLAAHQLDNVRFHFDAASLKRARPQDVKAVEKLLERWPTMQPTDRDELLERIATSLAGRLQMECPPAVEWLAFLQDFLASEYRRQHRRLG